VRGRNTGHPDTVPLFSNHEITALVAEDDDYDFLLLERALASANAKIRIQRARDGVEAQEYLLGLGRFADRRTSPIPDIVLLDLKMPRMSGFDLLEWIHANPRYAVIPTIIMSNSKQDGDVQRAYQLGANSYFLKPAVFQDLAEVCRLIGNYWSHAAIPPPRSPNDGPSPAPSAA
jgi:CheY-like chemotaxis protein